jgi:hypothetical protein
MAIRTSRAFDVIFIALLGLVLALSYFNRISIGDFVFFARHHPSARVVTLADDAGLSDTGRHLFYRGDPQIVPDAAQLAAACDAEDLGCITPQGQIFILDAPSQHSAAIVTATHEMLHLAYRRLDKSQKADVDAMIERVINQLDNDDLRAELDAYSPADRIDEAHSIIGSEYAATPELEDYYKQYFSDRSKVLAAETEAERQN